MRKRAHGHLSPRDQSCACMRYLGGVVGWVGGGGEREIERVRERVE